MSSSGTKSDQLSSSARYELRLCDASSPTSRRNQRGTLPRRGASTHRFPKWSVRPCICSHFFFTYSEQLSLDFHVASVEEMCRVACEARMFSVQELRGPVAALGACPRQAKGAQLLRRSQGSIVRVAARRDESGSRSGDHPPSGGG